MNCSVMKSTRRHSFRPIDIYEILLLKSLILSNHSYKRTRNCQLSFLAEDSFEYGSQFFIKSDGHIVF